MDTRTSHIAVAALLQNRCGMVCTVDSSAGPEATNHRGCKPAERRQAQSATRFFGNLGSEDHPPRTVALLPGRQCVAFGCAGGVEIHWLDEKTGGTQCRRLPMSQPSEILHFLPSSNDDPAEFRLISSLAGPGPHECSCRQSPVPDHSQTCPFHILSNKNLLGGRTQYSASSLSLVRATHCHNYRTVPINDGLHMIFVDPRTGNLSIGSNSPIGGPTSLTRAFVCVPPLTNDPNNNVKKAISPTAFAVGSDLDWGLRVVAAYQDRLILYSIPADIYNVIRKERERQNGDFMADGVIPHSWLIDSERIRKHCDNLVRDQNCDLEVALSVSYRSTSMVWPFKVYGKKIGRVDDVVEVALQTSNGGARAWAFAASGQAHVFDIDTVSTTAKLMSRAPVSTCVVNPNGEIVRSAVQACAPSRTHSQPQPKTRKRKRTEPHNTWTGQSAKARFVSGATLASAGTADHPSPASMHPQDTSTKRSSFAACIFDFKIPNLSPSDGVWGV
ncbi:Uncharacterized protein PECH_000202 [Penicillium ucsense]|uniref:Uncharacterized protein n=1 Tax=Penicillium ucsense TaxID=2839758 RepID=A0A8J8WB14_9EURO|nr:Uncharacterized protein PECM_008529 [Penicillium ucsense]KAF7738485.1 Uncharacterized protein PECH_000202 [Penicillium ucsense]